MPITLPSSFPTSEDTDLLSTEAAYHTSSTGANPGGLNADGARKWPAKVASAIRAIERAIGFSNATAGDGTIIGRLLTLEGAAPPPGGRAAFNATIGNGSALQIDVTHNLGTRDISVTVAETASPYAEVYPEVQRLTTNIVRLIFTTAPTTGEFRVTVMA